MHTSSKKDSGLLCGRKVEIEEKRYKNDIDLHDRYQAFSEQILRLSMAGIAVIGFLVALLLKDAPALGLAALRSMSVQVAFPVSAVLFGISAAFSLAHKFLASDGLYHHLRAIKLLILVESNQVPGREKEFEDAAGHDEQRRNGRFKRSGQCLVAGAVFLVLGALSAAWGFLAVLRSI